ncbi:MAG: hypothetical protein ACD_52C00294G0002 [uncultured bacterium]|uniref:Nucleotidyl transferase AbiEii/AbiGii toxin family protein n=1 Tax=Candidatus Woesebacteria bacterium RIFCSPHIGHO2_12_FULL_41_24 TaxID=1802510 RepID=A0A1F8ATT9_9BACT|nr:MAG: hypothetical protein ACD_52C00294G0002 [uncultured bacterium]OGM14727.1 MAG: hypothetical protein A2W15_02055 [Candidatus Woesebacteria bacterium RBG_16_41_13]OGM29741.1 MAG: hypothetical protein A2873_02475 [Candidatus Woesebacteria bacterium RIFCSPHIGHO2_01_FULL_42_80]OGM35268.1 MAG: hypothetical protein A3D84_00550 [Candidatus Woesebacteria bacterium RIFCSPHIGHO2_02_FULL_42_20]OGM55163.1 MAG: hypothetical protein A3E44_04560 [Candidatus Woesebacteria bacterium RIFCSPHIGHO2_12_FULL_41
MFTKALLPDTFRALQLVSKISAFQKAYLAGGTALALLIGHRISVDLDFFTEKEFDENRTANSLSNIKEFKELRKDWRTILGKINKTSVSLFYYKYPLIEKPHTFEEIQIIGKRDLAAMKLHAIEERGTRRDFIDLFFIANDYSLDEIIELYDQKYGVLDDHLYSIVRALNYFEDAERELSMPKMLVDVSWEDVKRFFKRESLRLAKEKLGV